MNTNFTLKIGLILALLIYGLHPTFSQLQSKPYYFDCGPDGSPIASESILLSIDDTYHSDLGYGWASLERSAFINEQFSRSRTSFNIDGIEGNTLEFVADLPNGNWWLTLLMDAGYEDSSSVVIRLNEKMIDHQWHPFQRPAESRTKIQSMYRVFHRPIQVENDSFKLSIEGGRHKARVLGFSLIPDSKAESSDEKSLYSELVNIGAYNESLPMVNLLARLSEGKLQNLENPFYAYWHQQVELLSKAEDHFQKRGWEKYRATTGLDIWGQLHQAVMILDGMLNYPEAKSNPLYERALFLRARILYWLGLERGGANEIARGQRDLEVLYNLHPDDQLLAMYNGEKVDLPDTCDELEASPDAPVWSKKQLELLCRIRDIAHWWVLEQQADNGEFGGKLGDDVELLRWWTPLLLSGDIISFKGWSKLADEVFVNKKVYNGYSKKPIDVEHASEFIADTAPLMVVRSDDPKYIERLHYSVDYFQNLWTGKSEQGHRFFKSAWFSSTELDERPPRNRDLGYNSRATKAVRYYAWKTGDPKAMTALHEWSEAWLSVAMSTEKGKPEGIIPASVRFPDESINGDQPTWYEANMIWQYFEWEANAGTMILDQLLFSYTETGDAKFLAPVTKTLELIEKHENFNGESEIGSDIWAVQILKDKQRFWSVAAQWRFMTGSTRFDGLLKKYGTPYLRYRLTGEKKHLEDGLEQVLENARYNTPLKTYEAIHTDRVYINGYEHLTTMLTGSGSHEGLSPNYVVTWEETNDGFTANVKNSNLERIEVDIYSHSDEPSNAIMRLWQLAPGDYEVVIKGKKRKKSELSLESKGQRFKIDLPEKQLITVSIIRK